MSNTIKTQIQTFFMTRGWKLTPFGHLTNVLSNGKKYRVYFQATSVRWEVEVDYENGEHGWVRLETTYYSKIKFLEDGRLVAFGKVFK